MDYRIIKKMVEAMEIAKKELGNAVVLMNVKQVKKKGLFSILKPQMVEVTVALEEEQPDQSANFRSAVAAVSEIAQNQVKNEAIKKETSKSAAVEKEVPKEVSKATEKDEERAMAFLEKLFPKKAEPSKNPSGWSFLRQFVLRGIELN